MCVLRGSEYHYEYDDERLEAVKHEFPSSPFKLAARSVVLPYLRKAYQEPIERPLPRELNYLGNHFGHEGQSISANLHLEYQRPGEKRFVVLKAFVPLSVLSVEYNVDKKKWLYTLEVLCEEVSDSSPLQVVFKSYPIKITGEMERLRLHENQDVVYSPKEGGRLNTLKVIKEVVFNLPNSQEYTLGETCLSYAANAYDLEFRHEQSKKQSVPCYYLKRFSLEVEDFERVHMVEGAPVPHQKVSTTVQPKTIEEKDGKCCLELTTLAEWQGPKPYKYYEHISQVRDQYPVTVESLLDSVSGIVQRFKVVYWSKSTPPLILGPVYQKKEKSSWCCSF